MKKLLLSLALITMSSTLWCDAEVGAGTIATSAGADALAGVLNTQFEAGRTGMLSKAAGAAVIIKDVKVSGQYIYVCGSKGSTAVMMVARFRKDTYGKYELDTNWGMNGYTKPNVFDAGTASVANAMAIRGGYIYLTGQGTVTTAGMVVVKIAKSDGAVVTAFSTDGVVLSGLGSSAVGHGIAVDGTNLYAVGTDGSDFAIMKMNKTTGVLDTAFDGNSESLLGGSNGELTVDVSSGSTDIAYDVVKDGNALYIVGDGNSLFAVVKMNATTGALFDGSPDTPAFDTDGIVNAGTGVAKSCVVDGTYLYAAGNNGSTSTVIKKYLKTTGALDTNFGTSGTVTDSSPGTAEDIRILNGQLYTTGKGGSVMGIARWTLAGALDTTFSTDGYAVTTAGEGTAGGFALDFLPDATQTVVVAGYDTAGTDIELAALNNDSDLTSGPVPTNAEVATAIADAVADGNHVAVSITSLLNVVGD